MDSDSAKDRVAEAGIWTDANIIRWTQLLLNSFEQLLGYPLIPTDPERSPAEALFRASTVVISHGVQDDPILNYGNQAALQLWEMDWQRFTQTPSRLTAQPMERSERQRMLAEAKQKGYYDQYRGIRISSTGKRFFIENAIIWNVIDDQQRLQGQAATFSRWTAVE
jgi:hypothetical protein